MGKQSIHFFINIGDQTTTKITCLKLNENEIESEHCIKFLGILIDEKVPWKQHLRYVESKVAKGTCLLHKV